MFIEGLPGAVNVNIIFKKDNSVIYVLNLSSMPGSGTTSTLLSPPSECLGCEGKKAKTSPFFRFGKTLRHNSEFTHLTSPAS